MKHSPFPWSVNRDPNHNGGEPVLIWGPKGPGHGAVAYTFQPGLIVPEDQKKEVEGNGQLIVAIPEMIGALQQAFESLVGARAADDSVQGMARIRIREILRKVDKL